MVAVQEVDEEEGAAALVAIGKRVVLDDEVEQVGGLAFDAGIGRFAEHGLALKTDVDENPETAREFGIMSIPTLLFKKDGQVVKQVAGVHSKAQILAILAEIS